MICLRFKDKFTFLATSTIKSVDLYLGSNPSVISLIKAHNENTSANITSCITQLNRKYVSRSSRLVCQRFHNMTAGKGLAAIKCYSSLNIFNKHDRSCCQADHKKTTFLFNENGY